MKRFLYLLIALALALWAQRWLSEGGILSDSAIFFLLGVIIFVAYAEPPRLWPEIGLRRPWPRLGQFLSTAGLVLAGIATVLFWRDLHSTPGLWLWLAAIPLYIAGSWSSREIEGGKQGAKTDERRLVSRGWEIALLVAILAFATFSRFYQLDVVPNGCQSDECNNGLDAVRWLQGAPYTVYAETNEGQATLFTYILALSFRLFGIGMVQMRLVSAVAGVLTVLVFYLLARDLFDRRVALAVTGLLAGSRWHITFSRIVYELTLMPLAEVLLFYFLLRALRWGRRHDWVMAGIMLGGGMHTYTAWRVIPFLIALFLVYWLICHRDRWQRDLEGIALLTGGALVTLVPLGVYIIQRWSVFVSRIQHISVFKDIEQIDSYAPLWSNLRKTLLMFNYQGDIAALNNLPGAPLLPFDARSASALMSQVPGSWLLAALVGVLFVLGIAYALRYSTHPLPFLLLAGCVFVGSIAVLSVAHEAPTARRPIGLVPIIFLLVGLSMEQIWLVFKKAWRNQGEWVFNAILAVVVAGVCLGGTDTYFNVQAKNAQVYIAYSGVEAAVGQYIRTLPANTRIYLVPGFQDHSAVKLIGGRRDTQPLNLVQDLPLREEASGDLVYIVAAVDQRLESLFTQYYPNGELIEHRDPFGRLYFISYRLTKEQANSIRGLLANYYQGTRWEAGPVALQRRDGPLSFDWKVNPPGPLPFSVQWTGSLQVPAFGTYRFGTDLIPGDDLSLVIGGQSVIDTVAGRPFGEVRLVAGFHEVTMRYCSTDTLGHLVVTWEGPNLPRAPIPLEVLYTSQAPVNGLVGYYFRSIDWSGTPALIEKDTLILPNNPLGERFSILWKGKVAAPVAGVYTFGTRSDDGSYVFIDEKMVVDNGGRHGSEYKEGSIQLDKGFHNLEVRYFQDGGSRDMQLWWAPPGGPKEIIPSSYLFPLESSEIPADLALPPAPTLRPPPVPTKVTPGPSPTLAKPEPPPTPAEAAPAAAVEFLWQAGSCGPGQGQFQSPCGVAVDSGGNVYVADAGNHRVVKLGPEGQVLLAFGREGEGDGEFVEPFDIVVEADGHIVVLDATAQQLQRFTADGRFVARFGKTLAFYRPRGLGLDADGNLLVADTGRLRLTKLSSRGEVIQEYGGSGRLADMGQIVDAAAGPGGFIYLAEAESGLVWRLGPGGDARRWQATAKANTVDGPHVAVGPDGAIYVTDPEQWRVVIYDSGGAPLAQFGGQGTGAGQFLKPVGLAVDQTGRVYVVDSQGCRVQAFGPQRMKP